MNTTAILKRAVEVFSFTCCLVAPMSAPASCPGASLENPETMTKSMRVCMTLFGTIPIGYRDIGTPLHRAAESSNDPAIVEAMVDAGADPNVRSLTGATPLHFAARANGNPAVVEFLLAAGADLQARDKGGSTPLLGAARSNRNPAVFAVLLNAGADSNVRDEFGQAPLHWAAEYSENAAVIAALLDGGAVPNAQDAYGQTPWDLAQHNAALNGTEAWQRLNDAHFQ